MISRNRGSNLDRWSQEPRSVFSMMNVERLRRPILERGKANRRLGWPRGQNLFIVQYTCGVSGEDCRNPRLSYGDIVEWERRAPKFVQSPKVMGGGSLIDSFRKLTDLRVTTTCEVF